MIDTVIIDEIIIDAAIIDTSIIIKVIRDTSNKTINR